MAVDLIGEGANELAQQEASLLAKDDETFGVLVFPAAVWENSNGQKSVIPAWYLCMTLDVGDSSGVAHCEQIAPLVPVAQVVRQAVQTTVKILRAQRDDPTPREEKTASMVDKIMGMSRTGNVSVPQVTSVLPVASTGPQPI